MKVFAAIQAGGRSTRMGTDKAWVELAGRPLIEYALDAAQPMAQRCAIVISHGTAQRERYATLAQQRQVSLLFDSHDYRGPLGGIHTALQHCAADETALILACDLPFITTEFLALLQSLHTPQITVPLDETGRRQMLAGFYDKACEPAVAALLAADQLRVDGLCAQVQVREVPFSVYAHLPQAVRLLRNLNTPEEVCSAEPE